MNQKKIWKQAKVIFYRLVYFPHFGRKSTEVGLIKNPLQSEVGEVTLLLLQDK